MDLDPLVKSNVTMWLLSTTYAGLHACDVIYILFIGHYFFFLFFFCYNIKFPHSKDYFCGLSNATSIKCLIEK